MLTAQQLPALAAAIQADPAFATFLAAGDDGSIAAAFNLPAAPTFWVYRDAVTQDEIMLNGFDWVRVDNLSAGKARIWEWLFKNDSRTINPAKANVRAGIVECWKGTAADVAVRVAVFAHCQRPATRGERLFATGAGTTIDQDGNGPGLAVFSGDITSTDVARALRG